MGTALLDVSGNREDCKGLLVYLCFFFMDLSSSCCSHLWQNLPCKPYGEGRLSYLFCKMHILFPSAEQTITIMAYGSLVILSTLKKKRTLFRTKRSKKHFSLSLTNKAVFVPCSFASLTLLFPIKYAIIHRVKSNSATSFSGTTYRNAGLNWKLLK